MTRAEATVAEIVEMREAAAILDEVAQGLGLMRFLIGPLGCVDDPQTRAMLAGAAKLMVSVGDRIALFASDRVANVWRSNRDSFVGERGVTDGPAPKYRCAVCDATFTKRAVFDQHRDDLRHNYIPYVDLPS